MTSRRRSQVRGSAGGRPLPAAAAAAVPLPVSAYIHSTAQPTPASPCLSCAQDIGSTAGAASTATTDADAGSQQAADQQALSPRRSQRLSLSPQGTMVAAEAQGAAGDGAEQAPPQQPQVAGGEPQQQPQEEQPPQQQQDAPAEDEEAQRAAAAAAAAAERKEEDAVLAEARRIREVRSALKVRRENKNSWLPESQPCLRVGLHVGLLRGGLALPAAGAHLPSALKVHSPAPPPGAAVPRAQARQDALGLPAGGDGGGWLAATFPALVCQASVPACRPARGVPLRRRPCRRPPAALKRNPLAFPAPPSLLFPRSGWPRSLPRSGPGSSRRPRRR